MTLSREATVPGLLQRRRWANWDPLPGVSTWAKAAVIGTVLTCSVMAGRRASPLLLFVMAGAVALALMLRKPVLGLAILPVAAMTIPFEIQASTSVSVNVAVFMVPVLLGVWVLDMVRRRALRLTSSATNAPLIAFVLSASLSLLLGNAYWDPSVPRPHNVLWVQLGQWSIYVFSMIAFWLGANLMTDTKSLKLVTYTYMVTGGGIAIFHLLPLLWPIVSQTTPLGATTSVYWLWLTALAGGQLLFNRQMPLPGKLFCLLTLATLWYFSLTGLTTWISGLLPMSVTMAALIALRFRKRSILIFLVVILLAVAYFPLVYQQWGWDEELQVSGRGRLGHYQIVLELAMRKPWFGLGMAAYRHYSWTIPGKVEALIYRGGNVSSHNNYIDIFAQMGAVGLAVFVWLTIAIGRVAWEVRRRFTGGFEAAYAHAALAGLAGTLVAGLLGDWFLPFVYNIGFKGFRSSVMIWVFLGGLVALDVISKTRTLPENDATP